MKQVKKVVIPAAGFGTRFLPLTKAVHKELLPILNKPILHHLIEEATSAGIEEIILVVSPRKMDMLDYFNINAPLEKRLILDKKEKLLKITQETNNMCKIKYVIQNEQLGLGHAIYLAGNETEDEPFAVILGDDLVKSDVPAIKQLISFYNKTGKSVLGVQSVEKRLIHKYGIVLPKNPNDVNNKSFEIKGAVEKPKPDSGIESNKAILGRYIFTPEIIPLLSKLRPKKGKEINLVDAFDELIAKQGIFAYEFDGIRYDLGSVEGFVKANIDYAIEDSEIKDEIIEFIKKK